MTRKFTLTRLTRLILVIGLVWFVFFSLSACEKSFMSVGSGAKAEPEIMSLQLWHYYSGDQQVQFERLVKTYNETVGKDNYVVINAFSKGSIKELADSLDNIGSLDSNDLPDISSLYGDMAYKLLMSSGLTDISRFLTITDLERYPSEFLAEGYIGSDKSLYILPWAKATDVLVINRDIWREFAISAGYEADPASCLRSWENIVSVADEYNRWSKGEAFIGFDSLANYVLVGSEQLGQGLINKKHKEYKVSLDREVLRLLWDIYYPNMVLGNFGAYGRFRTDDLKSGKLAAAVISSSGGIYLPDSVISEQGEAVDITFEVLPYPVFEGGKSISVLQGAGFGILTMQGDRQAAAAAFLLWLTRPEQNIDAALSSGYLPVTNDAINSQLLRDYLDLDNLGYDLGSNSVKSLNQSLNQIQSYTLYSYPAFENSFEIRRIIETSLLEHAENARLDYIEGLENGRSADDLMKQLMGSTAFESWYVDLSIRIMKIG